MTNVIRKPISKITDNAGWNAVWTGRYPNLCSGVWELYHDGDFVRTDIPFQGEPAGTYGVYFQWYFVGDLDEEWEDYEDGLGCDAWCTEYADWLVTVADKDEWPKIFEAFQASDWRYNSCGGCI